jgi:hypothetical protein
MSLAMLRYPFTVAPDVETVAAAETTIAKTVTKDLTIIDCSTTATTANKTLNLTIGSDIKFGSLLYIDWTASGGTRTLTLGTNITDIAWAVGTGQRYVGWFFFDGTGFVPMGAVRRIV